MCCSTGVSAADVAPRIREVVGDQNWPRVTIQAGEIANNDPISSVQKRHNHATFSLGTVRPSRVCEKCLLS